MPSLSDQELHIDKVQRIPKPKFLPDIAPRDVLAHIHFFYIQDRVMAATKHPDLPHKFVGMSLYVDLSQ